MPHSVHCMQPCKEVGRGCAHADACAPGGHAVVRTPVRAVMT